MLYSAPMQRVRIFVTGGTFDKEYNEITGELFFKDTHVNDMLQLGRCNLDVAVTTLMMIDSLGFPMPAARTFLRIASPPPRRAS